MKQLLRYLCLSGLILCAGAPAATLTLTPNPPGAALGGWAGQTVGWGFTIENLTDYLVVTHAEYSTVLPVGTFTDYISNYNFIVVGPSPESTQVSQLFNASALTGVGSYTIDPLAPVGALSVGLIQITYDLYSVSPNDPSFDSGTDTVSTGNVLEANASVEVLAAPEPGSVLFVGGGVLLAALKRKIWQ